MPMRRLIAILAAAAALALTLVGAGPSAAQVVCEPASSSAEDSTNSAGPTDLDPGDPTASTSPGSVLEPQAPRAAPRCRDADGTPVTPHVNAQGDLTIRDAQGNTVHGQTDAFGTTTFRPPPESYAPPRYETTPDGPGGAIFRDQAGRTQSVPVDPQGNSTFNDGQGHVRRCHTDPVGFTYCD
jgi:hypothetical protein